MVTVASSVPAALSPTQNAARSDHGEAGNNIEGPVPGEEEGRPDGSDEEMPILPEVAYMDLDPPTYQPQEEDEGPKMMHEEVGPDILDRLLEDDGYQLTRTKAQNRKC